MPDKSVLEKLIDRSPLAVVVIGVIVFIIGAAGGLPIGSPSLQIVDPYWRIALGVMGVVLLAAGIILLARKSELNSDAQWVSNFTSRYKELAEVDKGIKAALKEALDNQNSLNLTDKEYYRKQIAHMQDKVQAIETNLKNKEVTLEQLGKRYAIIQTLADLSKDTAQERADTLMKQSFDCFFNAVQVLRTSGKIESSITATSIFAYADDTTNSDPNHKLLHYLALQIRYAIQFSALATVASSTVPKVHRELVKNPHASLENIFNAHYTQVSSELIRDITEIAQSSSRETSNAQKQLPDTTDSAQQQKDNAA
jgi:hypothetical protein